MAGEKLVNIMEKMGRGLNTNADLIYGEVLSISPLSVKIDSKLTLPSEFLVKSALCVEKTITVTHYTGTEDVTLWRGLEIGDIVRMLRLSDGQKYYIIEREGGLTE